ncbi:VPLPA-CTERM sorting domain-containing protein [Rhodosalinus sp. K401]|uniref:VPLPA-CTERM sorting domain-containing protein n=1 Tax=Rhodosalinus sp. K401 TaxID=3239195 RepID=UPI0035250950
MGMRTSLMALAAGATLVAGAAQADTITQQENSVFGSNGSANVSVNDSGFGGAGSSNVIAGAFALNSTNTSYTDAAGDFVAFCLDIFNNLNLGTRGDYEVTTTPYIGATTSSPGDISDRIGDVQRLFNTAYAGVDLSDDNQSAGFQLALWEVVFEDSVSSTGFDLASGDFTVTNASSSLRNTAQGYLDGIFGANTGNYQLTYLESTQGGQNLVTMAPIPLPAGGVLLLGALGGLAVARRRRKA